MRQRCDTAHKPPGLKDCLCGYMTVIVYLACPMPVDPHGGIAIEAAAMTTAPPTIDSPSCCGCPRQPGKSFGPFHLPVPPQWRIEQLVALLSTPPCTCHGKLSLALWQT